jgi:hypothetical protein
MRRVLLAPAIFLCCFWGRNAQAQDTTICHSHLFGYRLGSSTDEITTLFREFIFEGIQLSATQRREATEIIHKSVVSQLGLDIHRPDLHDTLTKLRAAELADLRALLSSDSDKNTFARNAQLRACSENGRMNPRRP